MKVQLMKELTIGYSKKNKNDLWGLNTSVNQDELIME